MNQIRINKFIAETGLCSRRKADKLIEQKQVFINGKPAKPGDQVTEKDKVTVNGKPLPNPLTKGVEKIYIAFNKPFGVITTTDPKSENNVLDYIKLPPPNSNTRLFPIGRLDVYTTGLLLLTNDGAIANNLTKSQNKIKKVYELGVQQPFKNTDLQKMAKGMKIKIPRRHRTRTDEKEPVMYTTKTLPAEIEIITSTKIRITIIQGLNRQIRRMCETLGYKITTLKRIKFAGIETGPINAGEWRFLTKDEIAKIK